ncbi:30S ribosomal protein S5, partial [Clarias magur]
WQGQSVSCGSWQPRCFVTHSPAFVWRGRFISLCTLPLSAVHRLCNRVASD